MKDTHKWIPSNLSKTGSLMECSECGKGKLFVYRNGDFKCKGKKDLK